MVSVSPDDRVPRPIKAIARWTLPAAVRARVRRAHRRFSLAHALRGISRFDFASGTSVPRELLDRARYGWGNEGWAASSDLLAVAMETLPSTSGPILECGSGLSTLLLGVVAKVFGRELWTLEHDSRWALRVREQLGRHFFGADGVHVVPCALRDYGGFSWYDVPARGFPSDFGLVVCDGPPGDTPGGRIGLVECVGERLRPGCVILLDDVTRSNEKAILRTWAERLRTSSRTVADGSIGVIVVP